MSELIPCRTSTKAASANKIAPKSGILCQSSGLMVIGMDNNCLHLENSRFLSFRLNRDLIAISMAHDGSHLFISLETNANKQPFPVGGSRCTDHVPFASKMQSTIHGESPKLSPPSEKKIGHSFCMPLSILHICIETVYINCFLSCDPLILPLLKDRKKQRNSLIWCHGHPTTPTTSQGTVMKATNHWAPATHVNWSWFPKRSADSFSYKKKHHIADMHIWMWISKYEIWRILIDQMVTYNKMDSCFCQSHRT